MDSVIAMKEGDIYRWSYLEPGDDRSYGRYHCCSNIAILDARGRFRDTFWSSGSDGRSFGPEDLPKIELTFLGNLSDLERAPEYNADYYDDADIVNLNHSNSTSGNFYLRKGAKRSSAKMLTVARSKLDQWTSRERHAAQRADDLRTAIASIKAGKIDVLL